MATHFIGFKNEHDRRFTQACQVFGPPDFFHRVWDVRAAQEIAPGDKAVFADYSPEDEPTRFTFDDSNQPDDPAAKER